MLINLNFAGYVSARKDNLGKNNLFAAIAIIRIFLHKADELLLFGEFTLARSDNIKKYFPRLSMQ